jgi:hypothetical protein
MKYKVIAKVSDDHFVKYRTENLLKFTAFLDKEYSGWRWFNVFFKGEQIGNFTKNNRPVTKRLL